MNKPWKYKRPPQIRLALENELIVDNFAGGGGASMGIEQALGRPVDIAINHDPEAIAMHSANHPQTEHHCEDVFDVDPVKVCDGRPVGLAWFSPDCKHFSKAKGGKPVSKTAQVRMCGNSVPPPFSRALVTANMTEVVGCERIEVMAGVKS